MLLDRQNCLVFTSRVRIWGLPLDSSRTGSFADRRERSLDVVPEGAAKRRHEDSCRSGVAPLDICDKSPSDYPTWKYIVRTSHW